MRHQQGLIDTRNDALSTLGIKNEFNSMIGLDGKIDELGLSRMGVPELQKLLERMYVRM